MNQPSADPATTPPSATTLRQRAESVRQKKTGLFKTSSADMTPEQIQRALHELQVHQIELELQNDELRHAQAELDIVQARYFDFYDLAPVGYCTTSDSEIIKHANLTTARLLGVPRSRLPHQKFSRFISPESRERYHRLLEQLCHDLTARPSDHPTEPNVSATQRGATPFPSQTSEPRSEDVQLLKHDGSSFWVQLVAVAIRSASGVVEIRIVLSDITARKQAEEASRISDRALKSVSQGVTITGPDTRILSVNQAFQEITGYSLPEIMGRTCRFLQGPLTDSAVVDTIRSALRDHREFNGEILNYRKDGTPFWNELTISPVHDARGALTHYIGITRDITARKHSELVLRQNATRLQTFFEYSSSGIWDEDFSAVRAHFDRLRATGVTDFRAHFTAYPADVITCASLVKVRDINLQTLHILRAATKEEVLTQLPSYFTPAAIEVFKEELITFAEGGKSFVGELPLRLPDGRMIICAIQLTVIPGAEQTLDQILFVFDDITARKKAEAEFQTVKDHLQTTLNAIPDLLFEVGLDGMLYSYHSHRSDLLAAPPEQFLGKTLSEILPPDAANTCLRALQEAAKKGWSTGASYNLQLPHGDTWFELSVSAMPENKDADKRYIMLARDITARKRSEQQLHTSLDEKNALLKEVHHRVKNNLQVITSLLRLEAGRNDQPGTKAVLDDMKGRIRAMALLHEMLYRSGTFAAVDLGGYLRQIATQSFRTLVAQPGAIRLNLDLDSLTVEMDQAAPCGLLVNELISNCLKHGFPAGRSGEVHVQLKPLADHGQWNLRVSDNGAGLPSDFATRRGTSLGLQLVTDLATQLGGTLEIGPAPLALFSVIFTPSPVKILTAHS